DSAVASSKPTPRDRMKNKTGRLFGSLRHQCSGPQLPPKRKVMWQLERVLGLQSMTHLHHPSRNTCVLSIPTHTKLCRPPTILLSTATKSAEDQSVSTIRTCKNESSMSWGFLKKQHKKNLVSCLTLSNTGPHRTAALLLVGIVLSRYWPVPILFVKSLHFLRQETGMIH